MVINETSKSSRKRRSILQPNESLNLPTQEANHDELERRSSNGNFETIRKRLSVYSQTNSPTTNSPTTGGLKDADIKSHFEICIKLFAENKISQKNAWCLKIIDFMSNTINKHKDPLLIGSTSLDVSARIYSVRVDDIHADGLKLASNILKQADAAEDTNDNDDSVIEEDIHKKRKKKRSKVTVLKDPSSLYGKVLKLNSKFFHSRVNPDLGPVANLCTFNISRDHSENKFMLLSNEKAWPSCDYEDDTLKTSKKVPFKVLPSVSSDWICPVFKDFVIDEVNEAGDVFASDFVKEDTLAYDNHYVPVLDSSAVEHFDDREASGDVDLVNPIDDDLFMATITNNILPRAPNISMNVVNCQLSRNIENVWAGPSHWKLKCIASAKSRFTGQTDKFVTGRSRKKTNVKVEYDPLNYPSLEQNKKIKQKRSLASEEKLLLPSNNKMSDLMAKNMQLMSKPGTFIVAKEIIQNDNDAEEVENYNYDNLNDSQYCPSYNANVEELGEENEIEVFDDNLIQAPELVPKSTVPYAMQAKRMDMKKLKSILWSSICNREENGRKNKENGKKRAVFSCVYETLAKKLPQNMKKELTAPLAFVALLHLANEYNMELQGQADLKDFKILNV